MPANMSGTMRVNQKNYPSFTLALTTEPAVQIQPLLPPGLSHRHSSRHGSPPSHRGQRRVSQVQCDFMQTVDYRSIDAKSWQTWATAGRDVQRRQSLDNIPEDPAGDLSGALSDKERAASIATVVSTFQGGTVDERRGAAKVASVVDFALTAMRKPRKLRQPDQ